MAKQEDHYLGNNLNKEINNKKYKNRMNNKRRALRMRKKTPKGEIPERIKSRKWNKTR